MQSFSTGKAQESITKDTKDVQNISKLDGS